MSPLEIRYIGGEWKAFLDRSLIRSQIHAVTLSMTERVKLTFIVSRFIIIFFISVLIVSIFVATKVRPNSWPCIWPRICICWTSKWSERWSSCWFRCLCFLSCCRCVFVILKFSKFSQSAFTLSDAWLLNCYLKSPYSKYFYLIVIFGEETSPSRITTMSTEIIRSSIVLIWSWWWAVFYAKLFADLKAIGTPEFNQQALSLGTGKVWNPLLWAVFKPRIFCLLIPIDTFVNWLLSKIVIGFLAPTFKWAMVHIASRFLKVVSAFCIAIWLSVLFRFSSHFSQFCEDRPFSSWLA